MNEINASGEAYLSHTKLNGKFTLRLSVGSIRVERVTFAKSLEIVRMDATEKNTLLCFIDYSLFSFNLAKAIPKKQKQKLTKPTNEAKREKFDPKRDPNLDLQAAIAKAEKRK